MSTVSFVKVKRFLIKDSLSSYRLCSISIAWVFFLKIRFLITSSTLAEDNDNLVLNLPWILEKSLPLPKVNTSKSSWDVTITQHLPSHLLPKSSTTVWRFSISWVSSPKYWPISSIKNTTWWLFPFKSQYSLTLEENLSIVKE